MSKYITENERYIIETMIKDGKKPKEIAERIGKHYTTVYREIKRGTVLLRDGRTWKDVPTYCADVSQRKQEEKGHNKGCDIKLGNDYEFAEYVEYMIKYERYSPEAVIFSVRQKGTFKTDICVTTLYKYINAGVFYNVSNKDLIYGKQASEKPSRDHRPSLKMLGARTIEQRPKAVNGRNSYGNWEMDTVVSGKNTSKECLLVLTERMMREEIIRKIPDRTADSVISAINELEKEYGIEEFKNIFQTITCDNGVEFSGYKDIESEGRTLIYFCHPYCSSERGSNENVNRLIRRFVPKGADISDYSNEEIQYIQDWINNYPRRMFGGMSSKQYKQVSGIP